jgi:carbonic anhydrase
LREGNRRFVSDVRSEHLAAASARRSELASAQEPLAIILGCSDSRVPAEIVFDQGLDELRRAAENQSPNLRSIVDRIRPSVESLLRPT